MARIMGRVTAAALPTLGLAIAKSAPSHYLNQTIALKRMICVHALGPQGPS